MPAPASYDERLRVPLRWWALGTMFVASLLIAFLVATPLWLALSAAGIVVVVWVGIFVSYPSARVSVGDGVLTAGRARVPVAQVGNVRALDPEATRLLVGREADARAYLLIRPYLRRAVRVDIADPADPAPYWLVSTRRPDRLVAALLAARTEQGSR
jgi:hypothetical protein